MATDNTGTDYAAFDPSTSSTYSAPGIDPAGTPESPRLTRATDGRMIAGVCAGLARRYGWDVNLVRVLFVLSCLLPGPQFLAYLALWVIIPADR
ncbi:PspC domain-containing protein [Millisia brevis]|uniref:PspC domain-containing protein n=1 Tax=Millisia brevis TaxID=264148 RepID=UPI000833A022